MFQTKYERKPTIPEKNGMPSKTEKIGYIPPKIQIENMILAGQRLADSRRGYEFAENEEIPEDYIDPTRNPNFDLADASEMHYAVTERMRQSKAEKEAAEAQEKALQAEKEAAKAAEKKAISEEE